MEKQLIISVGREFGSGGHEVAQKLADDYGIALYDHDLLKEIATKKNLKSEDLEAYDELKWNRFDALVALAVVLLAVVSALCFYLPKNQSGALTVVIDISGQEVRRVPLSDFTETTVTSRGYTLHIAAEGGAVSVTDSDCPTQDCVHTGAISRAGQSIVCLPAQVVVHLEGASVPDAPDVIVG